VTESTKRVFLESAYFDPIVIRKTAKQLSLMTEAAQRFQRGADPEMTSYALNRAATMISSLAEGKSAKGVLDEYPSPLGRSSIRLRYTRANVLLGSEIPKEKQVKYLSSLGFTPHYSTDSECEFEVPSWRHDCRCEADLIEEIARLLGYENIPTPIPAIRRSDEIFAPEDERIAGLRLHLLQSGLTEIMTMSFSSRGAIASIGLKSEFLNMVNLANPLSENYAGLRTTLLPGIVETASHSYRRGTENVCIFEIGPVYIPVPEKELPEEPVHLSILLMGALSPKHWSAPARTVDFYDLKGYLESVGDYFGVDFHIEPNAFESFTIGESATIIFQNSNIGFMGRLKKEIGEKYDLEKPVYLLELDLTTLLRVPKPVTRFEPIPAFPPVLRDIALVVNRDVPAGELLRQVRRSGGSHLTDAWVFDVYTGAQIDQSKKSIAINLRFQSRERTLTETEVKEALQKILSELKERFGAELR